MFSWSTPVSFKSSSVSPRGNSSRKITRSENPGATRKPMRRDRFVECARHYIAALRHHMDVEDAEFFPRAEAFLSAEDRAAIAARLPDLNDPLFGTATRERYQSLSEALLAD